MKLSVIIVNYNVSYFLEQCLHSVNNAMQHVTGDVWVVDNNSVDGSVEMVEEKFPWVNLIANKENTGFSKANNQAMRVAKGEYMLLLNPDTLVEEDTFSKVVAFMDEHPDAGGLGVKMVDGKGIYLPESKRGLPSPWVSFCKIFGISKIFKNSAKLNWYHLGHLDKDEINEIEILSGAFMMMRKEALDKVGLLDEDFFMYGEDIDLSWRIIKGGYKNYYFPKTSIIHYKGESTKKGSLNYVFMFYNAMVIFAKKHFTSKNAKWYAFFINGAIYFRAFVSILKRFLMSLILPILDLALIFGGLLGVKKYYSLSHGSSYYDNDLLLKAFSVYAILTVMSLYIFGGYRKPFKFGKYLKGLFAGFVLIVLVYSLLPETLRFSRAIILLGSITTTVLTLGFRSLLKAIYPNALGIQKDKEKKVVIIGDTAEIDRVSKILNYNEDNRHISEINLDNVENKQLELLDEYLRVYKIDEVIFCAKNLSPGGIISSMSKNEMPKVEFKIAPSESLFIIGSNSIHKAGEIATYDVNSITKPNNKRHKRVLDIAVSFIAFIVFPFLLFFAKNKAGLLSNIFFVLKNKRTWVGYAPGELSGLPTIKQGVIHPLIYMNDEKSMTILSRKINLIYANDYRLINDIKVILRNIRFLGNKSWNT